jgi:Cu+-exporting ATPase
MAEAALNVLPLAAPEATRSRTTAACAHCGLPCLTTAVHVADKHFCCTGCQTVFEILTENGLGHFYELNERAGVTIKSPARADRFLFLDEPAVREKLIDFSDGRTSRVTLQIPAIHCVACVWLLENLFQLEPGVGRSLVNFPRREATLQFDEQQLKLSRLVGLLASLGYEPTLSFGALEDKPRPNPAGRSLLLRLGLAGFAFGNIMLISLSLYAGLDSQSSVQFKSLFGWVSLGLALPVVLFSAGDYWRSAWLGLRRGVLTIDQPIAVGIAAIFAWSTWEIVTRTGHGYFDSLCGLIFFLLIGRWFQQKTYERLSFDRDFKSFFPLAVTRLKGRAGSPLPTDGAHGVTRPTSEREEIVPLSNVAVGDRLVLRHGDLIPADARLKNGEGLVDYSFVTGEAEPVARRTGDTLYAGGQQMGGAIEIETIKPVSQSYLTSLWSHEAFAKLRDHSLDTALNRFTKRFVILVSLVALGAAAFWLAKGQTATAVKAFTSVLIVACPCALALSAPFALGTAMRRLARSHVFIKNPHVVESLARITTIVFDKTGTLTAPRAAHVRFQGEPLGEAEECAVLSVTRQSAHPLPTRITQAIARNHTAGTATGFREHSGKGMEGKVNGQDILLGSATWLAERGIVTRSSRREEAQTCRSTGQSEPPHVGCYQEQSGSTVHLAINGQYRGCFTIAAALRPETDKLISRLARQHELALLSGDNEREREQFSRIFGKPAHLHFNQSPLDKLGFIASLQRRGQTVMMVGDGLNDAGALKQSDVGVAVVENVGAFSPASDVILEAQRVPELASIMDFARGVVRIVWASIAISSLYNFIGLAIAASGHLSPVVCAVLMPISSISVVGFAVGATHWLARRTQLSPLNLILNPCLDGPVEREIKITSKTGTKEATA